MTAVLAFVASSLTPTGSRTLSRSDRAAIEMACRSGDIRKPEAQAKVESSSTLVCASGFLKSAAVTSPSSGRSGHLLPPGEKEQATTLAICLAGDTLAAAYATAAGCSVILFDDYESLPAFDIVWFGSGFLEQTGDEFAAQLSERHRASLIFDVLNATRRSDGNLRIVRLACAGARDVIEVTGPAVMIVSESAARPSYVSRYRRQQAKRQVAIVPAEVPDSNWQPMRPRTKRSGALLAGGSVDERTDAAFGMSERQTSATDQPIVADPKVCAEHLVRYLAHHGFLQRGVVSPLSPGGRGSGREGDVTGVEVGRKPDALARDGRLSSLASASGFLKSAVARRPRLPHEPDIRRLRQPRRVGSTSISTQQSPDRRPRLVGKPRSHNRGPRRIPGPPTSI